MWGCPKCHHANRSRKSWWNWEVKCKGCGKKFILGLKFHNIARGAASHGPHIPSDVLLPAQRDKRGVWRRFDGQNTAMSDAITTEYTASYYSLTYRPTTYPWPSRYIYIYIPLAIARITIATVHCPIIVRRGPPAMPVVGARSRLSYKKFNNSCDNLRTVCLMS